MSASKEHLAEQAADPAAGWQTLQTIVADHPELRPTVAANPAAYPELLEWLSELGDAEVDAALAARGWSADPAARATEALDVRPVRGDGAEAEVVRAVASDDGGGSGSGTGGRDDGSGTGGGDDGSGTGGDDGGTGAGHDARADRDARPDGGAATESFAPVFPPAGAPTPPNGAPTRLSMRDRMAANDSPWSHAPATRSTWAGRDGVPGGAGGALAGSTGGGFGAGTDGGPGGGPAHPAPSAGFPGSAPAGDSAVFAGEGSPVERRRAPIALLAVALAVVLIGLFVAWRVLGDDRAESTAAPTSPEVTATDAPTATPTQDQPTPTSPADLVRPAPQDAVQAAAFSSPSANIVCSLAAEGLSCTILEHDFAGPTGCAGGPTTISLDAEGAVSRSCAAGSPSAAPLTLQYGASATYGSGACTSTPNGMSCWDMRNGHGFTVARASVEED